VRSPYSSGETLEENETLSIEEVFPQGLENLAELGEGKVGLMMLVAFEENTTAELSYLGDTGEGSAAGNEPIGGIAKLLDFLVGEGVRPSLGMVLIVLLLPERGTRDLLGEL
jgi:hypothetical protein